MNNQPSLNINENGWLIILGVSNKQINISVSDDVQIFDKNNNPVIEKGDKLYIIEKDNEICVGSVWSSGSGKFYALFDDEYIIESKNNGLSVQIEYMDDGYYEDVITYENIGNFKMNVSDYLEKDVLCIDVITEEIVSSTKLSKHQIDELNSQTFRKQ